MNSNDHLALIDRYIYDNADRFIEVLGELCAIPSVTANKELSEVCARLVASLLNEQEIQTKIVSTEGNPIVIGESNNAESKTLLCYLHYDVQPPEPIDLWESPPFELTRRDNKLFARGAADDKGHILARLAAIAAFNTRSENCRVK
jgi:acetylornithine deacetylase/succinyl-diaminopimelate desuccinylase-like protein